MKDQKPEDAVDNRLNKDDRSMMRLLVYPGQRGFPGHGTFSDKAGIHTDKLGWLVTFPSTTHNICPGQGNYREGSRRDPTGYLKQCS